MKATSTTFHPCTEVVLLNLLDYYCGRLTIAWSGQAADSVFMTGPATTVFEGQITLPDTP